jgi:hypothetical protein
MTHAKVDESKVSKCLEASGGFDSNGTNSLLQPQIETAQTAGVVIVPSVFVNKVPVMGGLTFSTILKAICAGFVVDSAPLVCSQCATCLDEHKCVLEGRCTAGFAANMGGGNGGGGSSGVSLSTFAITLVVITVVFVVATIVSRQRQQQMMQEQVRGMLAEYMPIEKRPTDTSVGGFPDTTATAFSIEDDNESERGEFTLS